MNQKNPKELVDDLLDRVEKTGEATGQSATWIIRMATGNQFLHERLKKRAAILTNDIAKIERHLTQLESEQLT